MFRSIALAACTLAALSQPAFAQDQKKPSVTEAAGSVGGSVAGTVVGTTLGGPVGAVVGSTIGGAVGEKAGKVVHKVVHRRQKKPADADTAQQVAVANVQPVAGEAAPALQQTRDRAAEPSRAPAPPPSEDQRHEASPPPSDDAPKSPSA